MVAFLKLYNKYCLKQRLDELKGAVIRNILSFRDYRANNNIKLTSVNVNYFSQKRKENKNFWEELIAHFPLTKI
jgi:hypothetical protein